MVTYYNTKDMNSYASYLLSEEREDLLKKKSIESPNGPSYEQRKRKVSDADFSNWKESLKKK